MSELDPELKKQMRDRMAYTMDSLTPLMEGLTRSDAVAIAVSCTFSGVADFLRQIGETPSYMALVANPELRAALADMYDEIAKEALEV